MNKLISLLALLCISFFSASAQSDEINISAAFSSSIDLRISYGANINFTFATLEDYQSGKSGNSQFQVASSVNFNIDISMTPFTNADGDEINLKNLAFRTWVPVDRQSEEGQRWNFEDGNTVGTNKRVFNSEYYSQLHVATTSARTVITAAGNGNAGTYEDNMFGILFHFGIAAHQSINGINLPSLLDQNIAPGTYTCTVTLEAIPEAL